VAQLTSYTDDRGRDTIFPLDAALAYRTAQEVAAMMTTPQSLSLTPDQSPEAARTPCRTAGEDSFHERFTVQISPIDSVRRHSAGWHGLVTETIYAPSGSRIEFRFAAPVHLLVMYDEGARREGETSIEGVVPSTLQNFADKLTFAPAGRAYYEWHETSAATRVTFIYLDPTKLQRSGDAEATYVPRVLFDDSVLWKTATKLRSVIESGQVGGIPYSEALAAVLAHELPRSDRNLGRTSPVSRGGLTGWQTRAVIDYIEERVGEQISLITLARLARLSQRHFCRAFKRSFGIPPYQYHIQRRIARAKVLLADGANSITEVALILGYSQTSAFSVAFRKTTGRTPKEFRRDFT
jgi:AraC family transcriptional regulator